MVKIFTSFKWHVIAVCLLSVFFLASSGGRQGTYADAPGDTGSCLTCHNTGTSGGNISISGVPSTYDLGATYPLTLTITDADAVVGGFQIVAVDGTGSNNTQIGTFSTPSGTKLSSLNRLIQSTPKSFSGGSVSWTFDWTAPASGAPSDVNFYFSGNAANNNGGRSGDYGYTNSSGNFQLPIELTEFKAASTNAGVELYWETATQKDAAYFELERSADGDVFESIFYEKAEGTTSEKFAYTHIDRMLSSSDKLYYRLKMVDFDESYTYSDIISITNERKTGLVDVVSANPIAQGREIRLFAPANVQVSRLALIGLDGSVVLEEQTAFEGAFNLQTDNVGTGAYFLMAYDASNQLVLNKKIIVQ